MPSRRLPIDSRRSDNGNGQSPQQDVAVLHCSMCAQATASFAIECSGDYSERHVWLQTKTQAEALGWKLLLSDTDLRDRSKLPDSAHCNKHTPDGYEQCTREPGHSGPCAHALSDATMGAEWVCPMCVHRRSQSRSLYPPFSGKDVRCPKCDERTVVMKYERSPYEHLRRACGTCDYEWNESTMKTSLWTKLRDLLGFRK